MNCRHCKDTGIFWARHKIYNAKYVFKCVCNKGITLNSKGWSCWNWKDFSGFEPWVDKDSKEVVQNLKPDQSKVVVNDKEEEVCAPF